MTALDADWTVLVPVEVLEGETVPDAVVDLLSTLPVVVLGYHVLPEQTPPGQARMQFEDRAQKKLDELADAFREAGSDADTRLVFTHDEEQTLDRVADETGSEAILMPNAMAAVERLLVPIRGEVDVPRIATFVAALVGDRGIEITLYHVAETDEEEARGRSMLEEATEYLVDRGVPSSTITEEVEVSDRPRRAIADAAVAHDATVMGESSPSLRTFLFGEAHEEIAALSLGPVVVVRRKPDAEDADTAQSASEDASAAGSTTENAAGEDGAGED